MHLTEAAAAPSPQTDTDHESFCSNAIRNPDGSWWVMNTIKLQELPAATGRVKTIVAGVTVKPDDTGLDGDLAKKFVRFCSRKF